MQHICGPDGCYLMEDKPEQDEFAWYVTGDTCSYLCKEWKVISGFFRMRKVRSLGEVEEEIGELWMPADRIYQVQSLEMEKKEN